MTPFYKIIKKSVFTGFMVFILSLIMMFKPAYSAQYIQPSMDNLTRMLFGFGVLDLSDTGAFSEFMKVNFCNIYNAYSQNEFEWKEIHQKFLDNQNRFRENDLVQYKLLTNFEIKGYNFSTMSLEIIPEFTINSVKAMAMNVAEYSFCEKSSDRRTFFKSLPHNVILNLESSLNLYRIPLNADFAEVLISKLEENKRTGNKIIYATIFVKVETAKKAESVKKNSVKKDDTLKNSDAYGYVEKISFYTNSIRRVPFKTIYYDY